MSKSNASPYSRGRVQHGRLCTQFKQKNKAALMASVVRRHPLLIPSLTTAILFGTGDVIAQQFVQGKGRNHDYIRTGRLAFYGGLIFAPAASQWYKLLDRLPVRNKAALVASRVALDQLVFAPVAVGVFFTATTLMEGKSMDDVRGRLEMSYKPTILANWCLFVPFQTLNMAIIPLRHRLLAVNVVSLFWNTYLSTAAAKSSAASPPVSHSTI